MKSRALLIIVALIVAMPVLLLMALNLVPDDVYRSRIIAAAKQATGRDLTIEGDIGVSLYPVLGAHAEGVRLANAPGFSAPDMVRMTRLDAGVALLPLLSGKVEIARFVLVEPVITLEVNADGTNNWTFTPQREAAGASPGEEGEAGGASARRVSDISLSDVRIEGGQVSYVDRKSGETYEASDIDLAATLKSLDDPLDIKGSLTYKGEPLDLVLTAESPRAFLTAAGTKAKLGVNAELLALNFEGTAALEPELTLAGPAEVSSPSLRRLMAWVSEPMTPGQGFGPFAFKGQLAVKDKRVTFDDAAVSFDSTKGTGALSIDASGVKPYLKGTLALDSLDTNPYLGAAPAAGGSDTPGTPGDSPGSSAPASSGWSTAPIDLAGLRAADADFALTAKKIVYQKMDITNGVLTVTLRNGVLTADVTQMALYGGTGKVKIVLDGAGAVPGLRTDLALSSIAMEPLLKDFANSDRLIGTGNFTLSVAASGKSQRAMVQSLNGGGALKIVDGAIRGIDLASMARNIASAFTGASNAGPQKTDFAEFGGTFGIANGVLVNNDLALVNPFLRLSGQGTSNLVDRSVNYLITPKAVASIEGQGGRQDLTGISVPIRVTGTWDNLKYAPDAQALVGGALKGVTDALGSGGDPLKGALQGLMGRPGTNQDSTQSGGAQTEAAPAEEPAKTRSPEEEARDLFKGIFGPPPSQQ